MLSHRPLLIFSLFGALPPLPALPRVHHRDVHTHLPTVHPADASRAGHLLLPTVRDPSAGYASGAAETKGGEAR